MAPTSALIQINSRCVLSVRIFINRNKILKGITNSDTIFEAPILSNNSIVRLKSPSIRLLLSNEDMKSLTYEIRDSLLFILYELCSPLLEEQVLNKLKVGTFMDFSDVLQILRKGSKLSSNSTDLNNCIDGIDVHIVSIERTGKKRYKLHFSSKWKLDIIIEDIDKLSHWRKLLVLLDSIQSVPSSTQNIPLFIPFKSTNVLVRSRQQLSHTTEKNEGKTTDSRILVESDEEAPLPPFQEEEQNDIHSSQDSEIGGKKDNKKPIFDYQYKGMRLFDKCISIHVLQRPKRIKKNR